MDDEMTTMTKTTVGWQIFTLLKYHVKQRSYKLYTDLCKRCMKKYESPHQFLFRISTKSQRKFVFALVYLFPLVVERIKQIYFTGNSDTLSVSVFTNWEGWQFWEIMTDELSTLHDEIHSNFVVWIGTFLYANMWRSKYKPFYCLTYLRRQVSSSFILIILLSSK